MRSALFYISLLQFITLSLSSLAGFSQQVREQWVRRYSGPENVSIGANDIAVDASGNIYVTGGSRELMYKFGYTTIKYDPAGNVLWIRSYNGSVMGSNESLALELDASGNIYVTGRVQNGDNPDVADYATIKYDSNGNELWVRIYNGPGNGFDVATSLAVDALGNVYVTGLSEGDTKSTDYATIKYDSNGNELWVRMYNGPVDGFDFARSIAVDIAGNVYVTGLSTGSENSLNTDYLTIKYNTAGNEQWVRRYNSVGEGNDGAYYLTVDTWGNVYVTGQSQGSGGYADPDYATIKYDKDGNELWIRKYNSPGNGQDIAHALAVDNAGNVYVTGSSGTINYNASGVELWTRSGYGNKIVLDAADNIYIAGSESGSESGLNYATIKYDRNGNELWKEIYNGPANGDDAAHALVVNTNGDVYVTGSSFKNIWKVGDVSFYIYDFATIKYTQTSITNVSCGKKGNKVLVCHKGKPLCISSNAVDAHLRHGDKLGSCNALELNSITQRADDAPLTEDLSTQFKVSVAPNPFNTTTRFQYELPADGTVSIKVYDATGREVATVIQAERNDGVYSTELNVTDLTKGVYYYRALLTTRQKTYTQTGKLVVIK